MKEDKQPLANPSLILGGVIPTAVLLYSDWCYVRKIRCPIIDWISEDFFLPLLIVLAATLFYFGIYRQVRIIALSLIIVSFLLILLVLVNAVVLWEFHFWIGGSK